MWFPNLSQVKVGNNPSWLHSVWLGIWSALQVFFDVLIVTLLLRGLGMGLILMFCQTLLSMRGLLMGLVLMLCQLVVSVLSLFGRMVSLVIYGCFGQVTMCPPAPTDKPEAPEAR